MNKAILSGCVGKDPEVRQLDNGTKVARFSFVTTESFRDKDGQKKENTDWHDIVVWGKPAEMCEMWVRKGTNLIIEGKIKQRKWEDKDGKMHYSIEIHAERLEFQRGNKKESDPVTNTQNEVHNQDNYIYNGADKEEDGDELPF